MRGRGHASRGFSLLELVVVIAVVSILIAVAAERLFTYREQVEKVAMEQMAGILKSAMHLQVADLIARQEAREIPRLAGQNPMDWLAEKPGNYVGEFGSPDPGQIPPGSWYFDPGERTLVYVVRYGNYFVPDRAGRKRVRYRVELVESAQTKEKRDMADISQIVGVKLAVVEPYRWF